MKYIIILIAILAISCKKDYQVIVKYKLEHLNKPNHSYCNQIEVTYMQNGKTFTQVVDTGWVHSFDHVKNTKVYLKVRPLCTNTAAVGLGYVDGNWFYQAMATDSEPAYFEAELPN